MTLFFRAVLAGCFLGLIMVMSGCGEDNAKVSETPVPKEQLGGVEAKAVTPKAPMVKGPISQDNYQEYMKATSNNPMQTKGYPGGKKR